MFRKNLTPAVCITVLTVVRSGAAVCEDRRMIVERRIMDVSSRLKQGLNPQNLIHKRTRTDLTIFNIKGGKFGKGLTHARVATIEIPTPIEEVASCWFDQHLRKEYA